MDFTNIAGSPMNPMAPATFQEAGVPGKSFDWNSMIPMLSSMLGNVGQAISTGDPSMVNQALQNQIQSQMYRNMLQQILGEGGKVTMGEDGTSIKIPKKQSALGGAEQPQQSQQQTPGQFYDNILTPQGKQGFNDPLANMLAV